MMLPSTHVDRLSDEMCLRLVASREVGRLTYLGADDEPAVVWANYALAGGDLLLPAFGGADPFAFGTPRPATFEVAALDDAERTGWSLLIRGAAMSVADTADVAAAPSSSRAWRVGGRQTAVVIRIERITGRLIVRDGPDNRSPAGHVAIPYPDRSRRSAMGMGRPPTR